MKNYKFKTNEMMTKPRTMYTKLIKSKILLPVYHKFYTVEKSLYMEYIIPYLKKTRDSTALIVTQVCRNVSKRQKLNTFRLV